MKRLPRTASGLAGAGLAVAPAIPAAASGVPVVDNFLGAANSAGRTPP